MIKIRSRSNDNREVLLNTDNVSYITPTSDLGTLIYFIGGGFLSSSTPLDDIQNQLVKLKPDLRFPFHQYEVEPTKDGFPGWLPRNPSGNVDKRTNAFKDYIASLEVENT